MEQAAESAGAEAEAAHLQAVKAAEGVGVLQDWTAALDHLQRAAELGSRLAQAELAGLAGQWPLARDILAGETVPEAGWSGLHRYIDLAEILQPPRSAQLSQAPRIAVVQDIVTPEMCDWLIARAQPKLERAVVYDNKTGSHRSVIERTNTFGEFPLADRDLIFAVVRARVAGVTGLPVRAMEIPNVLHYEVGEEYQPHFDTPEDPDTPGFRQRVLTFLISLNSDYEGGETDFPVVGGRWKGRKGGGLFFWNVGPDGRLDRRTLHAGRPVTRGVKWLLSQWIMSPEERLR
jgi:prolyl 4-hydroxylase